MSSQVKVEDLESALMDRARSLADEYLARARRSRNRILEEENERLRLREEREVLAAKAAAERGYRRQVQAEALKLQEQLDRLRWELVQQALANLTKRLDELAKDEERYWTLMRRLLAEGARSIGQSEIVAEVNGQDLERLKDRWDEFANIIDGARIDLSDKPLPSRGGVLVRSPDNTIRVDNTFEGRLQRLEEELHQVLVERMFAQAPHRMTVLQG
jgi:V/A-type H+-transporting ATPase subunit E